MESHDLTEPFGIEDGSLDGLSREMSFVLGVEWEMFRRKLAMERPFRETVISHNARRLVRLAERHGRFVESHPHRRGWVEIVVGDLVD
jgi:hypothetical protein